MKRWIFIFVVILNFAFLSLISPSINACTEIQLKAKDGSIINGRTLEFGIKVKTAGILIPRNYEFKGTLPDGNQGLSYRSKYAVVGSNMYDDKVAVDGLNEAGLSAGAFYFPGYAKYPTINDSNKAYALSPVEFTNWVLTQFSTVDEVEKALKNVVIAPTVYTPWGFVPPFHYIICEKTGKCIVVEPTNGTLTVFNDPLGVFTNSPTFDWHITNLRNYINLSPLNVPKVEIKGITLKDFGQGSGLHGLPGDFTSPSRFVRAAVFSSSAIPEMNAKQTVLQMFHILNQFDIPIGSIRTESDGKIYTDYTQVTVVRDPQNLNYYFKTYDDQSIRMIDLKTFAMNGNEIKIINTESKQPITVLTQ
jgi:choloylglycine hydrolase